MSANRFKASRRLLPETGKDARTATYPLPLDELGAAGGLVLRVVGAVGRVFVVGAARATFCLGSAFGTCTDTGGVVFFTDAGRTGESELPAVFGGVTTIGL